MPRTHGCTPRCRGRGGLDRRLPPRRPERRRATCPRRRRRPVGRLRAHRHDAHGQVPSVVPIARRRLLDHALLRKIADRAQQRQSPRGIRLAPGRARLEGPGERERILERPQPVDLGEDGRARRRRSRAASGSSARSRTQKWSLRNVDAVEPAPVAPPPSAKRVDQTAQADGLVAAHVLEPVDRRGVGMEPRPIVTMRSGGRVESAPGSEGAVKKARDGVSDCAACLEESRRRRIASRSRRPPCPLPRCGGRTRTRPPRRRPAA